MGTNWDLLVTDAELNKSKLQRSRDYIFKRQRASALDELTAEGWELESYYKDEIFIKVKKRKPSSTIFENKVWRIFFDMGFAKMNKDSTFCINYGETEGLGTAKQIDVFAADEEAVILVECKSAEFPNTKKDFKTELEALFAVREKLRSAIREQFGDVKLKVILATENIVLGGADKRRLEEFDIIHFDEDALDYYSTLAGHIKSAAKYQLLANLFKNQQIPNLPNRVPAIKGTMGGKTFYSFSIEPEYLLKIGYVLHRSDANRGMMPTYQRIIKPNRLKVVRNFVNNEGYFPNSIVISIDAPSRGLQFDQKQGVSDSNTKFGILHLPKKYACAYIIDGQHRLYGYTDTEYALKNTIPVVAFENLEKEEQVKLFMEINENQKAVPKNLRNTLTADMLWNADDYNDRRKALRSRIAQELGERRTSPLFEHVLIGENATTNKRCISMEAIDKGLRSGNYFCCFRDNQPQMITIFDYGDGDNEIAFQKSYQFLEKSFSYFKENLREEWEKGKEDMAILTINTGVYALLRIFKDILDHLNGSNQISMNESAEDLYFRCQPFYDAIISFYRNLGDPLREEIKKTRGEGAMSKHHRHFQKVLHDEVPGFNPEGFEEWWTDNSKEYNSQSRELVELIGNEIRLRAERAAREIHGEEWRERGIPLELLSRYAQKLVKANYGRSDTEKVDTWNLLELTDYYDLAIMDKNWTAAYKTFFTPTYLKGSRGSKKDIAEWILSVAKVEKVLETRGGSVKKVQHEKLLQIADWLTSD